MNRRTFFQTAATTLGMATLPGLSAARRRNAVNTVLGPVPADQLGRVLIHEHVLVDFVGADKIVPGRYDRNEVFKVVLPHLAKVEAVGCHTFVDCTPDFLGRDPELLRRLSQASGLHIVTNTGLYGAAEDKYVPRFAYLETAEQLATRWTREFKKGIPPSNIRPGFIKIGVDAGPLSGIDAKLVAAAALTHKRTGLVIAAHTGDGVAAMEELRILEKYEVGPSAFIWVHAQNERDPDVHLKAARMGAWVEFEGLTGEGRDVRADSILKMKQAGLLLRVLISNDAGWYNVGEPGGGKFSDYDVLFSEFLPRLRRVGLTEDDMATLLERNPQQALRPQI